MPIMNRNLGFAFVLSVCFAVGFLARQLETERKVTRPEIPEVAYVPPTSGLPLSQGSGSIVGQVIDSVGEPLGGVKIQAGIVGSADTRFSGSAYELHLQAYLRKGLHEYVYENTLQIETYTDESGNYEIHRLSDATYTVSAKLENFYIRPITPSSTAKPGSRVDFIAEPTYLVEVDVEYENGETAVGAHVFWEGTDSGVAEWSTKDRFLNLRQGSYRIRALQQAYISHTEYVEIDNRPGTSISVILKLKPAIGFMGRVILPEGEPAAPVYVKYLHLREGLESTSESLARKGNFVRLTPMNTFEKLGVAPGTYILGVGRQLTFFETVEVIDVRPNTRVDVELYLPKMERRDYIKVWAYDPSRRVANDVAYSLEHCIPGFNPHIQRANFVRNEDHSYRVMIGDYRERFESQEGILWLKASSSKFGAVAVEVPYGPSPTVTVNFDESGYLRVNIPDYLESGVEGLVRITLVEPSFVGVDYLAALVGADGMTELGPKQPGTYDVVLYVQAAGPYRFRYEILRRSIVLRPGNNEETLRMPPLFSLTVEFPQLSARSTLLVQKQWHKPALVLVRAITGGQQTFENLPRGEYLVSLAESTGSSHTMPVYIQNDLSLRFEPQPANALRVAITDNEGALGGFGLEDGDLIVAIRGEGFDAEDIAKLLSKLSLWSEVEITVIRNGVEEKLVGLPRDAIAAAKEHLGGRLIPHYREN